MDEEPSDAGPLPGLHQEQEHIISSQARCRRPRPVPDPRGGPTRMVPCGGPKCSRECRDRWAWKHAKCAARSFESFPPTHHLTIRPRRAVDPREFSTLLGKLMTKLRRWLRGDVEYVRIFEWRHGRVHAHAWLRATCPCAVQVVRAALRAALPSGIRFSCRPRRGHPTAVANYLFKHTRNPAKKAELPPKDFRGKLYAASGGFFTKPIAHLWREVKEEWRARTMGRASCTTAGPPWPPHPLEWTDDDRAQGQSEPGERG